MNMKKELYSLVHVNKSQRYRDIIYSPRPFRFCRRRIHGLHEARAYGTRGQLHDNADGGGHMWNVLITGRVLMMFFVVIYTLFGGFGNYFIR